MNTIETELRDEDRFAAKFERKSSATRALEILEHLKNAAPFHTTFIDGISQHEKAKVEVQLKRDFETWANSWIAPICRQIIAKNA